MSGERVEYRRTSADTGGELLQWVHVLEPGRGVPADHVHWAQQERFEILSGTARVRLGRQTLMLKPGDDLVIPAGTAHGLRNEGTDQLRVLTELRPAMRTEHYFETVFGLAHDGKVDKSGLPNLLHGSVIVRDLGGRRSSRTQQRPHRPVRIRRTAARIPCGLSRIHRYRLLGATLHGPMTDLATNEVRFPDGRRQP